MPFAETTTAPAKAVTATITPPVPVVAKMSGAGVPGSGHPFSRPSTAIDLFVAATAAGTSQVVDRGAYRGPGALVISNVGTGSPTVNVDIQGSVDNINFFNVGYALVATPTTAAVAQIAITATATTTYLLLPDQAWRYLRVVTSTVVTETYTVTYYQ